MPYTKVLWAENSRELFYRSFNLKALVGIKDKVESRPVIPH